MLKKYAQNSDSHISSSGQRTQFLESLYISKETSNINSTLKITVSSDQSTLSEILVCDQVLPGNGNKARTVAETSSVENCANKTINIGVQELYFVNKKLPEVANSACQSMVLPLQSVKNDQSVKPQWYWLEDPCEVYWSVSIFLLSVGSVCQESVCQFRFGPG